MRIHKGEKFMAVVIRCRTQSVDFRENRPNWMRFAGGFFACFESVLEATSSPLRSPGQQSQLCSSGTPDFERKPGSSIFATIEGKAARTWLMW